MDNLVAVHGEDDALGWWELEDIFGGRVKPGFDYAVLGSHMPVLNDLTSWKLDELRPHSVLAQMPIDESMQRIMQR
jgi:hypothetical protein